MNGSPSDLDGCPSEYDGTPLSGGASLGRPPMTVTRLNVTEAHQNLTGPRYPQKLAWR